MSKFDRVLVGSLGVVYNSRNEVLVVNQKQGPFSGSWLCPGGGVEIGESPEEASIREVREETGVEICSVEKLVGIYQITGVFNHKNFQLIMFVYKAYCDDVVDPEFPYDNVDDPKWVEPKDFPFHSTVKQFLRDSDVFYFDSASILREIDADNINMHKVG